MELLRLCEETCGRRQLVLHETVIGDVVDALGTVLDGRAHQTRIIPKRFWRLRGALTRILTVRRCSGRVLEIIIGHCTFVGLLARESLAVFHTVYAFIRKYYMSTGYLWQSVLEELRAFRGLLIGIASRWRDKWDPMVVVADASELGWGSCICEWPVSEVALVGRQV